MWVLIHVLISIKTGLIKENRTIPSCHPKSFEPYLEEPFSTKTSAVLYKQWHCLVGPPCNLLLWAYVDINGNLIFYQKTEATQWQLYDSTRSTAWDISKEPYTCMPSKPSHVSENSNGHISILNGARLKCHNEDMLKLVTEKGICR